MMQGVLAKTYFYNSSNQDMGVPDSNYKWTKIILNTSNFNNLGYNGSINNKLGTIAHEMGHAIGLAHSTVSAETFNPQEYTQLGTLTSVADFETVYHNLSELSAAANADSYTLSQMEACLADLL